MSRPCICAVYLHRTGKLGGFYQMRISNCKGCGRIFNVLSDEQYCPNCQKKMDEKFDIVKRFVEDNPNVPVETVA